MCSGGDNRPSRKEVDAHNEAAKRQYEYQQEVRRREWDQARSVYNANKIDFTTKLDNDQMKAMGLHDQLERVRAKALGESRLKLEQGYADLVRKSPGAKIMAKGRTGKSAERVFRSDIAEYYRTSALSARKLTEIAETTKLKGEEINRDLKIERASDFGKVWVMPVPGVMPPPPMKRHRGKKRGFFSSLLGIGGSVAGIYSGFGGAALFGSDIKLKANIKQVGKSPKGYKIYEWNYKVDKNTRYRGVIAQDVMKINPMAVGIMDGGHLGVYYDKVDVPLEVVS